MSGFQRSFEDYDADEPAPAPPRQPPLLLDDGEPAPEPPPPEPLDSSGTITIHPRRAAPVLPEPKPPTPPAEPDDDDNNAEEEAPPPPPLQSTASGRRRSNTLGSQPVPPPQPPTTVNRALAAAFHPPPILAAHTASPVLAPRLHSASPPPTIAIHHHAVTAAPLSAGRVRSGTLDVAAAPPTADSALSVVAGRSTVKIHFRNLTSGVSKVLPIEPHTTADALVAELLRKLTIAKIKVPDGKYELHASAAGFVHQFADHDEPLALLRQRHAHLICCRAEAAVSLTPAAAVAKAPIAGVERDDTGRVVSAAAPAPRALSPPPLATQLGRFQGSYQPPPPPPANVPPFSPPPANIVQKVEMLDDEDEDEDDEEHESETDRVVANAPHSNLGAFNWHLERQMSGRSSGSRGLTRASAEHLAAMIEPPPPPPDEPSGPPAPGDDDDEQDDIMFRRALNAHAAQLVGNDEPLPPPEPAEDDDELPPPPPVAASSGEAEKARRVQLVRELVDTERTYVRSLTLLQQHYMLPLEKAEVLSKDEIKVVFSNVVQLLAVHKELLGDLGARFYAATDQSPCVGDIFAHFAPYLKLYAHYYREFDRADAELKRLLQRGRMAAFCDKIKQDPRSRGLDLISYLIMPVQRLPRYVLLLEQLVDATPASHADRAPLTLALRQMREIVSAADAAVPPPPLTEAAKALAALGPAFAELNSTTLVLCDFAQRWRDANCKNGGGVRLWLLSEWIVVAPARGAVVPLSSSGKARAARRSMIQGGGSGAGDAQFSDVATVLADTPSGLAEPLRIPLSHVWVKRVTWSDGLFEVLTPLATQSFLFELPTRDRERWVGKLLQLTHPSALNARQAAERSRIDAPTRVYVNQIHWDSAFELPVDPRSRIVRAAVHAAAAAAAPPPPTPPSQPSPSAAAPRQAAKMTPEEVQEYKAMMKRRYAEEQRNSLALAAKRAAEAAPPPPTSQSPTGGDKAKRPKICQRCGQGKVYARCRVVQQDAFLFVCEPCATELSVNHNTKLSRKTTGSEPVPPPPPPE